MNILITGGLGYIGGRVADYLYKKTPDSNIFLTTRNGDRRLPAWTNKYTVLQMDLINEDSVANCIKNKDIDIIVHLAALNEIDSMKAPESALQVNTLGTYRLLKIADANKVNRFVYFSTFHVYGEVSDSIITEKTPTRPFHPYAITHRAAEDFVNFFNHYHKMKTLIFRLSNGYGYPMDTGIDRWTLVFNDLCRQAITTGRIVLNSTGEQHRDFISLHDVSRAVHQFAYLNPDNWKDGLFNLGGDCFMSILEVAQKISDIYKVKYGKELLGIETKPDDGGAKKRGPINYSIEKIAKTGFHLNGNMDLEIERTMELCEEFVR